jgi:hypothetical protein
MNISDDLVVAQRLPTDDGWSYTVATRLGQLLRGAEQQFGTRDTF